MSYKSEVALAITAKNYHLLKNDSLCLRVLKLADSITLANDAVLIIWTDIRWYTEMEPIKPFNDKLSTFGPNSYRFIEIGESSDHLVEAGYYYDNPFNLKMVRRFEYDDSVGLEVNLDSEESGNE